MLFTLNTHQDKALNKLLSEAKDPDMQIFEKIKDMLNRSFGSENNQIVKPSMEQLHTYFRLVGYKQAGINATSPEDLVNRVVAFHIHQYMIFIRFPEITIKNSKGREHKITDLYVILPISHDGKTGRHLFGIRESYSAAELNAGYAHSHLPRRCEGTLSTVSQFCLGDGPIRMCLTKLSDEFNEIDFRILLLHIKKLVCWESLEGTPHTEMSNVVSSSGSALPINISADNLMKGVKILKEQLTSESLKQGSLIANMLQVHTIPSGCVVLPTEEFEIYIANMLRNKIGGQPFGAPNVLQILYYKESTGKLVNCAAAINSSTITNIPLPKHPIFVFKGQEKFVHLNNSSQNINKNVMYGDPQIVQELCRQLSREFTIATMEIEANGWKSVTSSDFLKTGSANPVVV